MKFLAAILFSVIATFVFVACSNSDDNGNDGYAFVKTVDYKLQVVDEASKIEIMTYQMPNVLGKKADATALVFYPKTEKPKDGWRIVVWAHGTLGVGDGCAPSNNTLGERFLVAAKDLLKSGYVILATDYEGLGTPGIHPYLHLQSEAFSSIYAVSAIKSQFPSEFQGSWMVAGQSQGGQAALGTAEYANADVNFKGAVAGAPASALGKIITQVAPVALANIEAKEIEAGIAPAQRVSVQAYATLLSYAALAGVGINSYEPTFDYTEMFSERAGKIAKGVEGTNGEDGQCLDEVRNAFIADIIAYLTENIDAKLLSYEGINKEIFNTNAVVINFLKISEPGTVKMDKPILIIQGTADTSVPHVVTEVMVARLQGLGSSNVEFLSVEGASHTEAIIWKNAEVQAFIAKYMPAQ